MSLSRREILLICILLLVGTIYAFYSCLYMPVRNRANALKVQNNGLQANLQEAEQVITGMKSPANDLKKLQNEYQILLDRVPEEPYVSEMIVYLAESARDSQVALNSLDYRYDENQAPIRYAAQTGPDQPGDMNKPNPLNAYHSSQVEVEIQGDYNGLLAFLSKLENAPRLYVLCSAKFEAGKHKSAETGSDAPPQTAAARISASDSSETSTPEGSAAPTLAGSALYDGNNITLKLKFDSYYDQTTTGGMKGVDQEVSPVLEGKNPFIWA